MVIPPAFTNTNFPCENVPLAGSIAPGFDASFSCVAESKVSKTRVLVNGGTPPYTVTTNKGVVTPVDVNLFDIKIAEEVGLITYPSLSGFMEGDPTIHSCIAIKDRPGGGFPNPGDPGYDPMLHTLGERWAYIRLGMNQRTKGIFANCRHNCTFVGFDCYGRYLGLPADIPPTTSGTVVGDNFNIIEPFECPFSYENQSAQAYSAPGRGLGPCYDAHDYDLFSVASYPPVWYWDEFGETPPRDFAACGKGSIDPGVPNDYEEVAQAYLDMAGPILDVRHPNLIGKCTPCALVQGSNATVTIVDSALAMIIITVPIL